MRIFGILLSGSFIAIAVWLSQGNALERQLASEGAELQAFDRHIPSVCRQWYPEKGGYHGFAYKRPDKKELFVHQEAMQLQLRASFYACVPQNLDPEDRRWKRNLMKQRRCYGPEFTPKDSGIAWGDTSLGFNSSQPLPPYPGDRTALVAKLPNAEVKVFYADFADFTDHGFSEFSVPLSEILDAESLANYRNSQPVYKELTVFLSQGVRFMNMCRGEQTYYPKLSVGYFTLLVRFERTRDNQERATLVQFKAQ